MPKLRVHNFSLSFDGYAAGPNQTLDDPIGAGGHRVHDWMFATKAISDLYGDGTGHAGLDNDFVLDGDRNIGATIMGRNMFGPIRGDWPNDDWRGWWGAEPPYHHPVFVLTHHARASFEQGETTFHFTDEPIEAVLDRAFAAADGRDVRLGGGASTVRQDLAAGLIDELHLATSPVLLGAGEPLFQGLGPLPRYEITRFVPSQAVVHTVLTRK